MLFSKNETNQLFWEREILEKKSSNQCYVMYCIIGQSICQSIHPSLCLSSAVMRALLVNAACWFTTVVRVKWRVLYVYV